MASELYFYTKKANLVDYCVQLDSYSPHMLTKFDVYTYSDDGFLTPIIESDIMQSLYQNPPSNLRCFGPVAYQEFSHDLMGF